MTIQIQVYPESDRAGRRIVSASLSGQERHRGTINPNDDRDRFRFITGLSKKIGVSVDQLQFVDDAIVSKSDQAAEQQLAQADEPPAPEPWQELESPGDESPLPFPLVSLPSSLQAYVTAVSTSLCCPTDFVAVPLLGVAGGIIGNTRAIMLKQGWIEGARVYAGIVAGPGAAKSPAIRAVVKPVFTIQEKLVVQWEADIAEYEVALAEWEAAQKERGRKRDPDDGPPPMKPTLPVLQRCVSNDATREATVSLLVQNKRGFISVHDELTGWVAGMNAYRAKGAGSDRQFFLALWSGETIICDRKSNAGPQMIVNPFMCILGGMTDSMLGSLQEEKGRADGFVERLLLSFPAVHPEQRWSDHGVPDATSQIWSGVVSQLASLEMRIDEETGRPESVVSGLSLPAKKIWKDWFNAHSSEMLGTDLSGSLVGFWSKLRAYCGRLALIVHQLRIACGEVDKDTVDEESLRRAILLVDYFKSHGRRVHGRINGRFGGLSGEAKGVLGWAKRHSLTEFSERDLWRDMSGTFGNRDVMGDVLNELSKGGLIRRAKVEAKKTGRKPSPAWELHPDSLALPQLTEPTKPTWQEFNPAAFGSSVSSVGIDEIENEDSDGDETEEVEWVA